MSERHRSVAEVPIDHVGHRLTIGMDR
jgi:hypothetical protein